MNITTQTPVGASRLQHLIEISDLTLSEIDALIATAEDIVAHPTKYADACHGKILAALFFEPSTRTRLSFEAAMLSLGGSVIGFADAGSSSSSKGESVADTIRMVSAYADIAVMRHPKEGAPLVAGMHSDIPVINAGDGGHNHPTQTLTDLYTIKLERGRLDNLHVGLCGDLKFGRTVHSLLAALSRYAGNSFALISPEELRIPEYLYAKVLGGVNYTETTDLMSVIAELDMLYMTRVQRERFFNEADYIRLRDSYILTAEKMQSAHGEMVVMHPLPRVNEIATEVDSDPRAAYFRQAKNGKYIRMALILKLLGV